jgi:hypothetical protein
VGGTENCRTRYRSLESLEGTDDNFFSDLEVKLCRKRRVAAGMRYLAANDNARSANLLGQLGHCRYSGDRNLRAIQLLAKRCAAARACPSSGDEQSGVYSRLAHQCCYLFTRLLRSFQTRAHASDRVEVSVELAEGLTR